MYLVVFFFLKMAKKVDLWSEWGRVLSTPHDGLAGNLGVLLIECAAISSGLV